LVDVTAEIRAEAVRVVPTSVRSLDARHLATALVAGLQEFASFDVRQQVAAEEAGLHRATP
jgi:predicted nucleic acid-binding protein